MKYSSFQESPFCTGTPIFTLAEPNDLLIVCGEFSSDVEILKFSKEPEQVFQISRITNHPNYQPNRVTKLHNTKYFLIIHLLNIQDGIGQGGPIDGYDIAVYHVTTEFKLGSTVDCEDTSRHIWPVCLPKNDGDYGGLKDGFIAGWLDTPPVSQLDPLQLGIQSSTFKGPK